MNKLTPQIAARNFCDKKIKKGFKLIALHEYQDISGTTIFWRIRLKNLNTAEKIIWPMHQDRSGKFFLKEPDFNFKKKPIYKLPDIINNPEQPIYIHEGEKCVDEFIKMGLIATTSGGWNSAEGADWEILKGKK